MVRFRMRSVLRVVMGGSSVTFVRIPVRLTGLERYQTDCPDPARDRPGISTVRPATTAARMTFLTVGIR
ncbi:hypothetical protein GCM10028864_48020 [Microlunatus parietis]